MSVYSGFATRQQEKKYNDYIMTLLSVVLKRMLKFYAGEPCDEQKFKDLLQNICERMITLEQGKFLEPKYSGLLLDTLQTLESLFGNAFFQKEGEFSHTFLDLKDLPNPKIKMNTIDDPPEVVTKQDYDRSYRKGISNMAVTNLVETNRKIKTIDSPSCGSLKKHSVVSSDNEEEMLKQRTFYGGRLYRDRVREASKDRGEMIRMGYQMGRRNDMTLNLTHKLMKMPKLYSFLPTRNELSPREYLKQTVLSRREKGEYLTVRKRQKQHRIITS